MSLPFPLPGSPFFSLPLTFSSNLSPHLSPPMSKICRLTWSQNFVCVCVCLCFVSLCVRVWPWQALLNHESFTLTSQHKSPLWQTHTHTHLARRTAPGDVSRFGDPLYVNFVREPRKKTNREWASWKGEISDRRSKTETGRERVKNETHNAEERERERWSEKSCALK